MRSRRALPTALLALGLAASLATTACSPAAPGQGAATAPVAVDSAVDAPGLAPVAARPGDLDAAGSTTARTTARSGCNVDAAYEICFNSPGTQGGSDAAVVRRFVEIFDSAGEGDSLRIAMFRWDIPATTTAIVGALGRGATVEVVADADVTTKAAGKQLLEQVRAGGGVTVVCQGACLPWRGSGPAPPSQDVNHHKLLLADIDGQKSVITSSSNFEGRQYSQYNSLARVFDDAFYDWTLGYWERLKAQSWTVGGQTWKDKQKAYAGPPPAVVYPRKRDLVVDTLKKTQCVKGARTVDIMVAVIQRYDVREQIGRLAKDGCKIRIVTTRDLIENWLQKPFKLKDGRTVDLPDRNVRTIITHDKVYAIHAKVAGKVQHVVLTGTSNTTCGGLLYNDELMMRLEGKWVFKTYVAHVADAFKHARQAKVGTIPVQARCR